MENASKALIIAGSILIAMIVLSILVWGWNRVARYYEAEQNAETVQQLYKKNKELESYNKQVIRGYELRSLYNLIEDMNRRYSEEQGYTPITAQLEIAENSGDATESDNIDLNIKPFEAEDGKNYSSTDFTKFNDNKNNTLCIFMKNIYDKYDNSGKKTFNESYFKCEDIKYNGELEGQDGKGTARVQSFKFKQIKKK